MKIKNDPMFEIACGLTPGAMPPTEILYVVYRGHETNTTGCLKIACGGIGFVKDTDVAKKKNCECTILCAYTDENDAQNKVLELNQKLIEDDVKYKYQGVWFMPHPEIETEQVEEVALQYTDTEIEYSADGTRKEYSRVLLSTANAVSYLNSKESILKRFEESCFSKESKNFGPANKIIFIPLELPGTTFKAN